MCDEVYQTLGQASSGFVTSPAGCGKTEAIVRTVANFCCGRQLILTHTHAGVDALRQRFHRYSVPNNKYHVDTIAGWCWNWVRRYPVNAGYVGCSNVAEWNLVYPAMSVLLRKDFVRLGITNSYAGIIVDEYQDCTTLMHRMIADLKALLPCRVLGDDLQGIFDFGESPLVNWSEVIDEFVNDLGELQTPYRWLNVDNEELGRWLLNARSVFRNEEEPDYDNSPIDRQTIRFDQLGSKLIHLTRERRGRICVIGPKARPLYSGIETSLVNRRYRVLEANELPFLRVLITVLSDGLPSDESELTFDFLTRAYGGLSSGDKTFIRNILFGNVQRPRRADRRALCDRNTGGTTPQLVSELLRYCESIDNSSCKLSESISALKCILEKHQETSIDLKSLYADEIGKRKYQNRSKYSRCVGSTLLVKGLEFDHAIIIRDPQWRSNWGNYRDLYVALTRGSKTVTILNVRR